MNLKTLYKYDASITLVKMMFKGTLTRVLGQPTQVHAPSKKSYTPFLPTWIKKRAGVWFMVNVPH